MEKTIIKTFNGGSWIYNSKEVNTIEEADIVILPGGGDLNPALYGHEPNGTRGWSDSTDEKQMALVNKAINKNILVFGICRGLQLLTARNGGFLIQDVDHPSRHPVVTSEGEVYGMNSCHHQMCYPYNLPREKYEVLAWTEQLSKEYRVDEKAVTLDFPTEALDADGLFKEPEMIWYPETRWLGVQGHPEWSPGKPALDYINKIIREKLNL